MTDHDLAVLIYKRTKEQKTFINPEDLLQYRNISALFIWANTKEGHTFWKNVNNTLGDNLNKFLQQNLSRGFPIFINLSYYI